MSRQFKKILIVEDDSDTREILKLAIESEGYEVSTALNGQLALDSLKNDAEVSLILLDMMMPQMSGRELLDILSVDSIFKSIPVIFIAADVPLDKRAGSVAFIPKPADLSVLFEMIDKHALRIA